jgi:hypothetical protein
MTEFKIFPVWNSAIYAAEHEDLKPLTKRCDQTTPCRSRCATIWPIFSTKSLVSSSGVRSAGREPSEPPRKCSCIGREAGCACGPVTATLIKTAWNHPEAAKQLAESDPDLAVCLAKGDRPHTSEGGRASRRLPRCQSTETHELSPAPSRDGRRS